MPSAFPLVPYASNALDRCCDTSQIPGSSVLNSISVNLPCRGSMYPLLLYVSLPAHFYVTLHLLTPSFAHRHSPTHLYLRCTHEHPRSSISKPPTPLVLSQNMHFCHRSHLAHAQRRRSVFSYPPAPLDVRPACTLYPPPASYSSNMPVRTLQPAIPPFGAIPGADTLFLSPYTPNPRCYTTAWLPMPSFSCCTHQLPSSLHRHHCFSYPSMPITSPSDQECPSYLYPHPTPSHVDSGIFARCPFLI